MNTLIREVNHILLAVGAHHIRDVPKDFYQEPLGFLVANLDYLFTIAKVLHDQCKQHTLNVVFEDHLASKSREEAQVLKRPQGVAHYVKLLVSGSLFKHLYYATKSLVRTGEKQVQLHCEFCLLRQSLDVFDHVQLTVAVESGVKNLFDTCDAMLVLRGRLYYGLLLFHFTQSLVVFFAAKIQTFFAFFLPQRDGELLPFEESVALLGWIPSHARP